MALRLPPRVALPEPGPIVPLATVRAALGVSRQRLLHWRRGHGFPSSHNLGRGWFIDRAAVENWLIRQGVEVIP